MIATVHFADIGRRKTLSALRIRPEGTVAGLRFGATAFAADIGGTFMPKLTLGRLAFVGFWDDDSALETFKNSHPLAEILADGWQIRLEPIRATGTWPGLPDIVAGEGPDTQSPAAVLTLGRLRSSQALRFRRFSMIAERHAKSAAGLIWATAIARPPLVATFSLWESAADLREYAYAAGGHTQVLEADRAQPFHHRSAFVRFQPTKSTGRLTGPNPLAENWADGSP
ncbi:hypothetical protein ACFXHA_05120 [Nocardia sp. NPDC059240]|uniref:hypothetical protein n=1 Tax=Nocardia sp. NPDC059240 TaxID=3346786 RepID=UPI0036830842